MEDKPRRVFPERREWPAYKTGLERKAEIMQRRMDSIDVIKRFNERFAPIAPPVSAPEQTGPGRPDTQAGTLALFHRRRADGIELAPTIKAEAERLLETDQRTGTDRPTAATVRKTIAPAYAKAKRAATKRA
jgi:hypothetical protein